MKRFLSGMISLLLAAFLAIMLLPGSGANAYIVDYGTCGADGADIKWELDSEGILTIQGEGKMKDWNITNDPSPWYRCADVKTVVIGKDVTSIGDRAFHSCSGLKEIIIPDSVTSIGNGAFYFCSGLKEITIPDSVTSIGKNSFACCYNLESIIIPDRVTSISNGAFVDCKKLESITIPDSITSIGNDAFYGCSGLKEITIPNSVTSIGNYAFYYCPELKEITIPDRVTSISESAFACCYNLESITIPDSVTSISEYAFYGCSGLKEITIPDRVTSIGASTFECCYNLESITIPDSVTSIGLDAFNDCSSLKKIVFPDKESYAFDQACFAGCTSIETVIVNSEAELNPVVFSDCSSSFESFYYYDVVYSAENGTVEGKSRSYAGDILELDITPDENYIVDKVTLNGNEILSDENGKYRFEMPDSDEVSDAKVQVEVSFIPGGTCGADGDNITWALNSEGILTIQGSGKMKDWNLTNDLSPWYRCADVKTVVIGKGVTSIGEYAFTWCEKLESITIPDSVTSIGVSAFEKCYKLESITIPDSVTSIGYGAFYYCSGLKEITIPDSVTSIGNYAFYQCSELKEITIPDSVTSIGEGAFEFCKNLKSIIIPDSVTSIGNKAFYFCSELKEITIPDSVTSIGERAFHFCSGLKEITIPDSVTSIGNYAFKSCTNLNTVYLPDNPKLIIGQGIFDNCNNLEYVILNPDVTALNYVPDSVRYFYYDVKYAIDGPGTISGKTRSYINDVIELTVEPEDNYTIDKITFIDSNDKETPIDPDKNGKYTYTMPDSAVPVKFKAYFKPIQKVVTFCNEDGTSLQSDPCDYGTSPKYAGGTPTKPADAQYTYTFAGWTDGTDTYGRDETLPAVYDDVTYTAVFKPEEKLAVIDSEIKASFEAFVERMYVVVLDRPSEPEGKTYWTDKVINGELTGADCARNFLNGQEFKDRNLSDEEFVTVLYKAFFDRDAKDDPDGFNFWMESLKVTGRENIIEGFISSPEWIDLCSEYCVKPGTAKAVTGSAADFATRLYTECLGREPDEEGLKFWSQGLIDHKITGSQAAHEFFYSAEFNSLNLGNKELITRMYKTFLGRDPEDEGLAFWMDSMDKGMTKDQLFDSFVNSKEFSEICVSYAIERG